MPPNQIASDNSSALIGRYLEVHNPADPDLKLCGNLEENQDHYEGLKGSAPDTVVRNLVLEPVKDWKDSIPDTVVRKPSSETSKGLEGQYTGHSTKET